MAWFKKAQYTRIDMPKTRDRVPQGLMAKCDWCVRMLLQETMEQNLWVCPHCGHHHRINARKRIEITFDFFEEDNADIRPVDALKFVDLKPYPEHLKKDQKKTGLNDAVITGVGEIHGFKVAAAVMEFGFRGASMGSVVGEKITRAFERGLAEKRPVLVICTSGGARMQEGILSLMQMVKTSAAVARLGQAGIPYITLLTNPTTAGVMASYASLGDVIIAEPKTMVGFAGPRVIEQTIKQILPKGFQTAEFVREKGFIDIVVSRLEMRDTLARLLSFLSGQTNSKFPIGPAPDVIDAREVV